MEGRGGQVLVLGVQGTEGGGELVAVGRQDGLGAAQPRLGTGLADQSWSCTELTRLEVARRSRRASTSSLALSSSPLFPLYSWSKPLLASPSILSW